MNNDDGMAIGALLVVVTLVIVISIESGVTFFQASHKAAVFNRLSTGPKVTAWGAPWLELRVDAKCQ